MNGQALAILGAQARSLWNYFPRANKVGVAFGIAVSLAWYGMWCLFAFFAMSLLADPADARVLSLFLGGALLLIFLYWQIIPVLMATTGASLDIKKLIVYPIPHAHLFGIEVLLRVTTGIEMLLLLTGIAAGLLRNPRVPAWAPLALLPFIVFNLCVAAGTREILARLFARKRIREVAVLLLVLCGALPQVLIFAGAPVRVSNLFQSYNSPYWPWSVTALIAQGTAPARSVAILLGWTAAAYLFGRRQFERGLRFDADAARATADAARKTSAIGEALFRWPSRVFPDPLAALVEKEIRFLSRAPRFRLVFTMGFTFGLAIWLPIASRNGIHPGFMSRNYLTLVCVYALLLLGDVCFWNSFGFDRRAAQLYFVAPVRFETVLLSKNITALFFILLEITAIIAVCALLRIPVTLPRLGEAYAVTLVITIFLVSMGNLTSTHNPRAVDPDKSMRSGAAGRMQALLVLVYPFAALPVLLAYLARYAFDSQAAFYAVLAVDAAIGAAAYWVAAGSSVAAAERNREQIVDKLSQGDGVIQA